MSNNCISYWVFYYHETEYEHTYSYMYTVGIAKDTQTYRWIGYLQLIWKLFYGWISILYNMIVVKHACDVSYNKKKPSHCKTNNTSTGICVCDDAIKFSNQYLHKKN